MKELKNIKELFKYTRRYSMWLGLGGLMLVTISLINIGIAEALRKLTDYAINKNWLQFINVLYYLLVLLLFGFIFKYAEKYFSGKFTSKCIIELREKFIKRIVKIRIDVLESSNSADILSAFSNDMRRLQIFFQSHLISMIYQILMVIASFSYLFIINKKVTLAIILVVPIVILMSNFLTKSIGKLARNIQNNLGESNIIVQDAVSGIYIVKSFNLEEIFKRKYIKLINNCTDNGNYIDKKMLYMELVITIFQIAPYMVFCIYGGFLLKHNSITVGELIAFLNLFDNLYMSLCEIQYSFNDIRMDMASIDRIVEVLNFHIEEDSSKEEVAINNDFNKPIVMFNNVSFSYKNKRNTLKNISFNIINGHQIIIVGESGCGKSTVFKLITNFYNNYTGDIELFGKDIREWNLEKLRNQISIVSQDVNLFPGTIKENISFGKNNSYMEEIVQAAKKANAHEFIMKLPNGYDTVLEENASNLSGGEKQRIAIARAVIKNSPILLLDEATSALDSDSAQKVQVALNNLMEGKTTLIITHKLESIKASDDIVFIKQGEIIASNTLYKQLYTHKY